MLLEQYFLLHPLKHFFYSTLELEFVLLREMLGPRVFRNNVRLRDVYFKPTEQVPPNLVEAKYNFYSRLIELISRRATFKVTQWRK